MLFAFDHGDRPRRLATVSSDGRVSLFDTASSSLSKSFARPTHLALRWTCISWQSSGAADGLLALGSDAGVAVVWDVARGEIVHELRGHTQTINDVSFCSSASGPQLITASEDRQICCWDLKSGSQLATHKTGKTAVSRLAVTSSASHVMLGSSMLKLVTCSTWKRVGYSSSPRPCPQLSEDCTCNSCCHLLIVVPGA